MYENGHIIVILYRGDVLDNYIITIFVNSVRNMIFILFVCRKCLKNSTPVDHIIEQSSWEAPTKTPHMTIVYVQNLFYCVLLHVYYIKIVFRVDTSYYTCISIIFDKFEFQFIIMNTRIRLIFHPLLLLVTKCASPACNEFFFFVAYRKYIIHVIILLKS